MGAVSEYLSCENSFRYARQMERNLKTSRESKHSTGLKVGHTAHIFILKDKALPGSQNLHQGIEILLNFTGNQQRKSFKMEFLSMILVNDEILFLRRVGKTGYPAYALNANPWISEEPGMA